MRKNHLIYLACPACQGDLSLAEVRAEQDGRIEEGTLRCASCGKDYPIVRHVPRFVPMENYASGFGLQWTIHAKTQYDSHSGVNISERRFFAETGWPRDLTGRVMLEAGSGSGRFTEQAAKTGAMVVSMDYSYAVDANYQSNGNKENVLIVQGDIYHMPFHQDFFDNVVCIGVLQHTPDVKAAFMSLVHYLKPGGSLVVDLYPKGNGLRGKLKDLLRTKYWVRPLTRRLSPEKLYRWCARYVKTMWPLSKRINRIPRIGRYLNWALLIADYRGRLPLSESQLMEWAILDTFDMLSPAHDNPQTVETLQEWFDEAGLVNVQVQSGCEDVLKGPLGRGNKRAASL
jgi:SAM-dependent methyltransferase